MPNPNLAAMLTMQAISQSGNERLRQKQIEEDARVRRMQAMGSGITGGLQGLSNTVMGLGNMARQNRVADERSAMAQQRMDFDREKFDQGKADTLANQLFRKEQEDRIGKYQQGMLDNQTEANRLRELRNQMRFAEKNAPQFALQSLGLADEANLQALNFESEALAESIKNKEIPMDVQSDTDLGVTEAPVEDVPELPDEPPVVDESLPQTLEEKLIQEYIAEREGRHVPPEEAQDYVTKMKYRSDEGERPMPLGSTGGFFDRLRGPTNRWRELEEAFAKEKGGRGYAPPETGQSIEKDEMGLSVEPSTDAEPQAMDVSIASGQDSVKAQELMGASNELASKPFVGGEINELQQQREVSDKLDQLIATMPTEQQAALQALPPKQKIQALKGLGMRSEDKGVDPVIERGRVAGVANKYLKDPRYTDMLESMPPQDAIEARMALEGAIRSDDETMLMSILNDIITYK